MFRSVYRFEDFVLNTGIRELRRGVATIDLPPKVFDCIAYLLDHRDRAVGQDELIAAVWGRTELAAGAVRKTILRARRALGDDGETPRMLGTVPRFGYRWIGEVQVEDEPGDERLDSAAAPREATRSLRAECGHGRGWLLPAAIAVVLATAVAVEYRRNPLLEKSTESAVLAGRQPALSDAEANLVIVLPVDVSTLPQETWLRFGLMDLIGNRLRNAGVAVMPSSSVVALAGMRDTAGLDPSSPALRARWLLYPDVSRAGDAWIVRVRLHGHSGSSSTVSARDTNIVMAARTAVDELAARMGLDEKKRSADQPALTEEMLQRAEARVLVHDLDGARNILRSAPAKLGRVPEVRLRLARIELEAGDYVVAERAFRELMASLPSNADPVLRARIQYGIGRTCAETMRLDEALQAYTVSLQLLEGRDAPADAGLVFNSRGAIHARSLQFDLASEDFSRAAVSSTLAGDALAVARAELNHAVMDSSRGQAATAPQAYEHAAETFERFGALNELSTAFDGLMVINLNLLQPARALAVAERSKSALERLENPKKRRVIDFRRAVAMWANGRLRDAAALLSAVERDAAREDDRWVLPLLHAAMVDVDVDEGRFQKALPAARAAVAELSAPEFVDTRAGAWLQLMRLMWQSGESVEEEVRKIQRWAEEIDVPVARMAAHLARAEHEWRAGERASARESFGAALQSADQTGLPVDAATAASWYAETLIDDGDLAGATTIVGRISRWSSADFRSGLVRLRLYHAFGQQEAWRSALDELTAIAGERSIPEDLRTPPRRGAELARSGVIGNPPP